MLCVDAYVLEAVRVDVCDCVFGFFSDCACWSLSRFVHGRFCDCAIVWRGFMVVNVLVVGLVNGGVLADV